MRASEYLFLGLLSVFLNHLPPASCTPHSGNSNDDGHYTNHFDPGTNVTCYRWESTLGKTDRYEGPKTTKVFDDNGKPICSILADQKFRNFTINDLQGHMLIKATDQFEPRCGSPHTYDTNNATYYIDNRGGKTDRWYMRRSGMEKEDDETIVYFRSKRDNLGSIRWLHQHYLSAKFQRFTGGKPKPEKKKSNHDPDYENEAESELAETHPLHGHTYIRLILDQSIVQQDHVDPFHLIGLWVMAHMRTARCGY